MDNVQQMSFLNININVIKYEKRPTSSWTSHFASQKPAFLMFFIICLEMYIV